MADINNFLKQISSDDLKEKYETIYLQEQGENLLELIELLYNRKIKLPISKKEDFITVVKTSTECFFYFTIDNKGEIVLTGLKKNESHDDNYNDQVKKYLVNNLNKKRIKISIDEFRLL